MEFSLIFDYVVAFLQGLSAKYPFIVPMMAILYTIGLASKLIQPIKEFIIASPSKKDDEILAKVEANPVYKTVKFVLDLFLRIKLK